MKAKKGRKPEPRGAKLHDCPKLELAVVKWLSENPNLSDLSISHRLGKEFKFKFSAPSVKAWKVNYYPLISDELKKKMQEEQEHQEQTLQQLSLQRLEYLRELKGLVNDITARMAVIKQTLPTGEKVSNDKEEVEINTFLESQYESFAKTKGTLLKQIVELLGPEDLNEKFEDIMKRTLKMSIEVFKNYVPSAKLDECMKELKGSSITLQREIREDLLIF